MPSCDHDYRCNVDNTNRDTWCPGQPPPLPPTHSQTLTLCSTQTCNSTRQPPFIQASPTSSKTPQHHPPITTVLTHGYLQNQTGSHGKNWCSTTVQQMELANGNHNSRNKERGSWGGCKGQDKCEGIYRWFRNRGENQGSCSPIQGRKGDEHNEILTGIHKASHCLQRQMCGDTDGTQTDWTWTQCLHYVLWHQ